MPEIASKISVVIASPPKKQSGKGVEASTPLSLYDDNNLLSFASKVKAQNQREMRPFPAKDCLINRNFENIITESPLLPEVHILFP